MRVFLQRFSISKQACILVGALAAVTILMILHPEIREYKEFSPEMRGARSSENRAYLPIDIYTNEEYSQHKDLELSIDSTDKLNENRIYGFCLPEL